MRFRWQKLVTLVIAIAFISVGSNVVVMTILQEDLIDPGFFVGTLTVLVGVVAAILHEWVQAHATTRRVRRYHDEE